MEPFRDVREHLAALEAARLLVRVDREVNKDTELGLPPLNLRVPWHGYELGWWTGTEREAGGLALEGRHFETGEKMRKQRVPVEHEK
jgi:hypothetical protein